MRSVLRSASASSAQVSYTTRTFTPGALPLVTRTHPSTAAVATRSRSILFQHHPTRTFKMQSSTTRTKRPVKHAHHISVPRMISFQGFPFNYHHHGLLFEYEDGTREIVHYSGDMSDMQNGVVQTTTLAGFLKGAPESRLVYHRADDEAIIKSGLKRFDAEEILERARRRLGERQYDLVTNNCEHFAHECLYGRPFSRQVDTVMSLVGAFLQQGIANSGAAGRSSTSAPKVARQVPDTEEAD